MSLKIHWDRLDREVSLLIQQLLNSRFRSIDLPEFLGYLRVEDFTFGDAPPHITLTDIGDPLHEFYVDQRSANADDTPTDVQLTLDVSYTGNMTITLATELSINFPSSSFLSLPLRLTVTDVVFSATMVIALLDSHVSFCFLRPDMDEPDGVTPTSLLLDAKIYSEIGEQSKQVLKNVGKIEKFVLEQLRKFIDQDLVFPSFNTVNLSFQGDETKEEEDDDDD